MHLIFVDVELYEKPLPIKLPSGADPYGSMHPVAATLQIDGSEMITITSSGRYYVSLLELNLRFQYYSTSTGQPISPYSSFNNTLIYI